MSSRERDKAIMAIGKDKAGFKDGTNSVADAESER